MATITLTETEQTDDISSISRSIIDELPESAKVQQNCKENNVPITENKNNDLEQSNNEPEKKASLSNLSKDKKHVIDNQLSTPEIDGNADSDNDSDGENTVFENNLELSEDEASDVEEGNKLPCQMPRARKACIFKGKGTRIQPSPPQVKCSAAFKLDLVESPRSNSSILAATSMFSGSQGGRIDFIVIHREADTEEVSDFQQHLRRDVRITGLTVELFKDMCVGEPELEIAEKLDEKCRCILIYLTQGAYNRYEKFIRDVVLRKDLKKENEDEANRIVPVLAPGLTYDDDILGVLTPLRYFNFFSQNFNLKENYIRSVKRLYDEWRLKLP